MSGYLVPLVIVVAIPIVALLAVCAFWIGRDVIEGRRSRAQEAVIARNSSLAHKAHQDQGRYTTYTEGQAD